MKTLLAWLFGTVTARITGAQPEDFLNLCARENLVLWRMVQRDLFTLEVQVTARQYARLCQLAQGAQCGVELEKRQGLPYFFLRFRRRYALLAGVALCLVLFAIGSRTVLTIDVTGNETVTREEIISQLRLCGVSVGTYGPRHPHPGGGEQDDDGHGRPVLFLPKPPRHPGRRSLSGRGTLRRKSGRRRYPPMWSPLPRG